MEYAGRFRKDLVVIALIKILLAIPTLVLKRNIK